MIRSWFARRRPFTVTESWDFAQTTVGFLGEEWCARQAEKDTRARLAHNGIDTTGWAVETGWTDGETTRTVIVTLRAPRA